MKLTSAATIFLSLAALHGAATVHGLTTQQAVCEKLVVDQVRGKYEDFAFPTKTTSPRNPAVFLCPHREPISKAIVSVANDFPSCKDHLELASSIVVDQCSQLKCRQQLQVKWGVANITGIDHVNFDERPEPGQLSIMCKHTDMVLSSMQAVGKDLPECQAMFQSTQDGLGNLCTDVRCITLVDDTLATNNRAVAYPSSTGEWEALCDKKDDLVSALSTVAQENTECTKQLDEAKTSLESVCLKKSCQQLLMGQWGSAMPSLQSVAMRGDMSDVSDNQQDEVCSNTKGVIEGMDKVLEIHPECKAYVGVNQESLDETCANARCARRLNDQLSLTRSFVAYVYPMVGEWSPEGKSVDNLNAVCGSKEQVGVAMGKVKTTHTECVPFAERAVKALDDGCESAGTACDKCLLGVASLIRLLPQVDTVVQNQFGGKHCDKIDDVALSLEKCQSACTTDPSSLELAKNVVSHAQEELGRNGECDIIKLDVVAFTYSEYDGRYHDAPMTDMVVTASLAVLGVAGLVIGAAIMRRRQPNRQITSSRGGGGGNGSSFVVYDIGKSGSSSFQSRVGRAVSQKISQKSSSQKAAANPMFDMV